jgi:hypothetical protein
MTRMLLRDDDQSERRGVLLLWKKSDSGRTHGGK